MEIYNYQYPVTITPDDDGGFILTIDDPDGRFQAADWAETETEALAKAESLLDVLIQEHISSDEAIPAPHKLAKGTHVVSPSPQALAKLALFREMVAQGVNKAELGRRLNWKFAQVSRLFDVSHASKLEQLNAAAHALNKRFVIGMDSAI